MSHIHQTFVTIGRGFKILIAGLCLALIFSLSLVVGLLTLLAHASQEPQHDVAFGIIGFLLLTLVSFWVLNGIQS